MKFVEGLGEKFDRDWKRPPQWVNTFVFSQLVLQGWLGGVTIGSGGVPWGAMTVYVLCGLGYLVAGYVRARREKAVEPSLKPNREKEFCRDCGVPKIIMEWQSGFNSRTGKPAMENILACPAWKPGTSPAPASIFDRDYYDCGNTVRSKIRPAHTHEEATAIDPECPGCIAKWVS